MNVKTVVVVMAFTVSSLAFSVAQGQSALPASVAGTTYTASFNADGTLKEASNLVSKAAVTENGKTPDGSLTSNGGKFNITFSVQFPKDPSCTYKSDSAGGAAMEFQNSLTTTGVSVMTVSIGYAVPSAFPFTITCTNA